METLSQLYKSSLGLLTDLYQLTMAYGYWKVGVGEREAVFHHIFRKNPFGGGYAIACGLHYFIGYLRDLKFEISDLEYLATLTGNDGKPLFDPAFLEFLRSMKFTLDIDAVQAEMRRRSIAPKAVIEGPPRRDCPILLRQTSFKALEEPILFRQTNATTAAGTHTARFGEIEQRGVALTPKGRGLYDRLLASARQSSD